MDYKTYTVQTLNDNSIKQVEAVCFLGTSLDDFSGLGYDSEIDQLKLRQEHDKQVNSNISVDFHADSNRLTLFKSVGNLKNDTDDPRVFFENANKLMQRAIGSGKTNIALVSSIPEEIKNRNSSGWIKSSEVSDTFKEYSEFKSCALAGALEATYVNLEKRERVEYKNVVINIFAHGMSEKEISRCDVTEEAQAIARDLGGSDPERMAPPRMVEYTEKKFSELSNVKVSVISDQDEISREFPAFQCVNRCTKNVPRHHGRIIVLEYRGEGPKIDEHLCYVGKGVTYDTGGADIKAGGHMAGMHRDKCGACNVIGLMYATAKLKPANINMTVIACCIRNSVGSEAYVADEIFKSRGGKYVRVCNTDAEGRMAMVDLLCKAKERAISENWVNPQLFTVATLTGHACIAFDTYTALLDNGPAAAKNTSRRIQKNGHIVADTCEISTIRREDYKASTATDGYADVIQSGMGASTRTPRGHQQPAGFMILASGLDNHGLFSEKPIAYTHCDIAPSAGPYPGLCTGSPIRAMLKAYVE